MADSIKELRYKVKVPSYTDLQSYTFGVIVGVGILSFFIGLFSVFFKRMLHFIYALG
jgi:preprotein translocase SecE subunit